MISCICPTYGRPPDGLHLLAEAVESFRRQQFRGAAELVILNDCPAQRLTCAVPGVRVINSPMRYSSLGEKYNAAIEAARGDILLPWEDDDISLPGRLAQAALMLRVTDYFNPRHSWYIDGAGLHCDHIHGVCHNASAFTRFAWKRAGYYPAASGAQDAAMDTALRGIAGGGPSLGNDPAQWQYIYRWGVSPLHLSGTPDHEKAYRDAGAAPHVRGTFEIRPQWRTDYAEMVVRALANRGVRSGGPVPASGPAVRAGYAGPVAAPCRSPAA